MLVLLEILQNEQNIKEILTTIMPLPAPHEHLLHADTVEIPTSNLLVQHVNDPTQAVGCPGQENPLVFSSI